MTFWKLKSDISLPTGRVKINSPNMESGATMVLPLPSPALTLLLLTSNLSVPQTPSLPSQLQLPSCYPPFPRTVPCLRSWLSLSLRYLLSSPLPLQSPSHSSVLAQSSHLLGSLPTPPVLVSFLCFAFTGLWSFLLKYVSPFVLIDPWCHCWLTYVSPFMLWAQREENLHPFPIIAASPGPGPK